MSNSKIRDIEASVNTFFNSIATNFNMAGYNEDILKEYVPALVYTMYDGFYIYSPFINTLPDEDETKGENEYPDDTKITGLKPYIHYSMRYKSPGIDVVITYSLDNYIAIQGTINGQGIKDSGYVIDNITDVVKDASGNAISVKYRGITIEGETTLQEYIGDNSNPDNLYNYIKINGVKYYQYKPSVDGKSGWFTMLNGEKYGGQPNFKDGTNYSAVQYYADAYEFGQRLESYGIKSLNSTMVQIEETSKKEEKFGNSSIFSGGSDSVEEPNSNFNQHRLAVIRYSIEKNLSIAIANYNNYEGAGKANFAMPELKEDEWDKILNNISIISFLQGLNIGGKVYNGYSIITNTKNKEVVSEESIYITTNDGEYHNVKEEGLNEKSLNSGVLNIDFERVSKLRSDGQTEYYYPKTQLGSYDSIITQVSVNDADNIYDYLEDKNNLAKIYYTALGRERNSSYKAFINAEDIVEQNEIEEIVVGKIVKDTNKTYDNNGTAKIPVGYMIVPGCEDVSKGLVISDNPGDTEVDSSNIVANGNQFVWIPVTDGSEYVRNKTYEDIKISRTAIDDTNYLPEGIIKEKQAVLSAGGFYIARYETGVSLVSKKGVTAYTHITQLEAKAAAKTFINNDYVKSALISGIQWDVTMETINGKLDGIGQIYDVTTVRNARHITALGGTGQNIADKVYNIYDLEGGSREYIAEKYTYNISYPFISRGGANNVASSASSRNYAYNGSRSNIITFRLVLYVM